MNLTPSQRLIFNLLQDGYPHTKNELRKHLGDELLEDSTLAAHVYQLRQKINPQGYDVMCRSNAYRLVRLLHSAYDGKR